MGKLNMIVRIVLGLIFFVFGLNGFFQFLPMQPNMPERAMAFFNGLMAAPYFLPVLKGTEVVCGALLLLNVYVPLSIIILAPIVLQIVLFHTMLAPDGMIMAFAILAMHLLLAFFNMSAYKNLLKAK